MRQADRGQPCPGPGRGGEGIGRDCPQTEVREARGGGREHRAVWVRGLVGRPPGAGQEALGGRSSREETRLFCSTCPLSQGLSLQQGQPHWGPSQASLLHLGIISACILVGTHIATVVQDVLPSSDALALAALIKALFVGASVLAGVSQPVHSTPCFCFLFGQFPRGTCEGAWPFPTPSRDSPHSPPWPLRPVGHLQ